MAGKKEYLIGIPIEEHVYCLQQNCAIWDEQWEQCSLKSIADALFNLNPKREVE